MFLRLWWEPWCYSIWGVEHFARLLICFTSPEEVFPIVRFQKIYRAVQILRQGGFNSPNGQSGREYGPTNKFAFYSVSVSFEYILVYLNQYLDAGKSNSY